MMPNHPLKPTRILRAAYLAYKGFSPKVKRFPHRDASRSDGSRNAFLN